MENKQIITGIDIGTTKIAVVIAECIEDEYCVLGFGEAPSNGLKKGIVVDMDQTIESLTTALSEAEKQADFEIEVSEKQDIFKVFKKLSADVSRYLPLNSFLSENATA